MAGQFDPTTAVDYGQFIVAAYTMYKNDPTDLNPPKSANFPSGYDLAANVQMSDFIGAEEDRKFYGFIAVSKSGPPTWVLAIRGTVGYIEWWDDFHLELQPFSQVADGGKVAAGFLDIYATLGVMQPGQIAAEPKSSLTFAQQVAGVVRRTAATGDATTAQAWATGHSLGAALVTLFVLDAAINVRLVPNVFTFASPRVGDTTLVDRYDGVYRDPGVTQTSWRIDNDCDIVPDVPPELLGYRHVDTVSSINSFDTVRRTFPCAHALNTYLYTLDPTVTPLDPGCQLVVVR
jgi:hypothetical protein